MISAAQWRAYNEAVAKITDAAKTATANQLADWLADHKGATVAEAREEAQRILAANAETYSQAAAALAADWYDAQGKAAGAKLDRAVTSVTVDRGSLSKTVRYQAQKLVDGDVDGFCDAVGEWAENEAKRALNATIMRNAKRDRRKGVMFARVTSGRNTCGFCLMLAGRGAVYHTRQSAGEMNRYHRHCSCKIVPSYTGNQYETLVEGHDPKKIENRLIQVENQTGTVRGTADFYREVSLRDPDWLLGEEARITYDKPKDELFDHELFAVDALHSGGFTFTVLDEDENAPANIDLLFDSGQLWEMKDVGDGKHSIEDQLKVARSKWRRLGIEDPVRVVITGTKMTRSEADAIAEITRRSHYYDEALFIKKDGSFARITK